MTVVASNYERRPNDLYETESWASWAAIRRFPVKGLKVWEPAAGNHKMADVLREAGADVATSDIATYDRAHDFSFDFLRWQGERVPPQVDAIYTNPPFGEGNRDAVWFAEMALEWCAGTVALLLTAKFDFGNTRHHLFRDNPRFTAKINLVDRIRWFPGIDGTEDFAWFIWTSTDAAPRAPRLIYEGKQP